MQGRMHEDEQDQKSQTPQTNSLAGNVVQDVVSKHPDGSGSSREKASSIPLIGRQP